MYWKLIEKITAKLFLEEGAKVMLVDLSENSLKGTVTELKSENVKYCVADVSVSTEVENYVTETIKLFGKIDVFFNNAGIEGVVKPIEHYPEDIFDKIISINVKGVWLGNKYVLPQMNDGGSIIMSSSFAGILGFAGLTAYVTSKHAVVGIMRTTALEASSRKIRVNTIHPSPVNNRMMRSIEESSSTGHGDEIRKQFEAAIHWDDMLNLLKLQNWFYFLQAKTASSLQEQLR